MSKPNVIAMAYVKVVPRKQLLITDNYMKQTKENLEKNNNVCPSFGIKIGMVIN